MSADLHDVESFVGCAAALTFGAVMSVALSVRSNGLVNVTAEARRARIRNRAAIRRVEIALANFDADAALRAALEAHGGR